MQSVLAKGKPQGDITGNRLNGHLSESIIIPDSPQTHQLIVQIDMKNIGISTMCSRNKKLVFPYAQPCIPAEIGETNENKWLIGPDLETARKIANSQLRMWSLETYLFLPTGHHPQEIQIDDQVIQITFEFLFGLFLYLVKEKIQTNFSALSPDVIITVPIWISSRQRQQLKDSGMVAGFKKVFIENENYILARSMLTNVPHSGEINSVAVITENSGNIDVTIHSLDLSGKRVSRALVHSGDYEAVNAFKAWEQIWEETLAKLQEWNKFDTFNKKSATFCIAWKSNQAEKDVMDMCNKIGISSSFHKRFSPGALQGLIARQVSDMHAQNELGNTRDGIAYPILARYGASKMAQEVVNKKDTFRIPNYKYFTSNEIPVRSCIFYENPNNLTEIGELHLPSHISLQCEFVMPCFEISSDGIVELTRVEMMRIPFGGEKSADNALESMSLHKNKFKWKSSNLRDSQVASLAELVHRLINETK